MNSRKGRLKVRFWAKRGALAVFSSLLLTACAVGPDFSRPPPPTASAYDLANLPAAERVAQTSEQQVSFGQRLPAKWWELFQSPALAQTLDIVIAGNNTLAAARATLDQAQQAIIAAQAGFLPTVTVAGSLQRSGSTLAKSADGEASSAYSAGPTLGYTVDVFGLNRRTVEQQKALADNQQYQLDEAYLTLTGGAVTQAIAIAAARLEIATAGEIVASDEKNLDLVRRKFEVGKAAKTDILTAESQLMADRTQLSALRQQLSVARHALAVLASRAPAEWSPPEFDIADFSLPRDLPASIPSELVRQRPDILAAEAELHAASAAIGMAEAQRYPVITLSSALTVQSLAADSLFGGSSTMWSLGSSLAAPIYQGGAIDARKQAAVDAFEAQTAAYRQTVIQALGQVADTLRALEHDAEIVANAQQSLRVSDASLALQRSSYAAGKTNVLDLISSERTNDQARLALATAQILQLQDTVQFFVVMGGGWRDPQAACQPERPSAAKSCM